MVGSSNSSYLGEREGGEGENVCERKGGREREREGGRGGKERGEGERM